MKTQQRLGEPPEWDAALAFVGWKCFGLECSSKKVRKGPVLRRLGKAQRGVLKSKLPHQRCPTSPKNKPALIFLLGAIGSIASTRTWILKSSC